MRIRSASHTREMWLGPAGALSEQQGAWPGELLFADGDLLANTVGLAAHAFGDLLDFTARLKEGFDLSVERVAGFCCRGWFGFGSGSFYAHESVPFNQS